MTEKDRVEELEEKVEELTEELERVKERKNGEEQEKEVGEIQGQIKDAAEESGISRRKFMKMIGGGAAGLSAAAVLPSVSGFTFKDDSSFKFSNTSSSQTNMEVGTGGDLDMHGNDIANISSLTDVSDHLNFEGRSSEKAAPESGFSFYLKGGKLRGVDDQGKREIPVGSFSADDVNTEWSSQKYLDADGTDESASIQQMIEDAADAGPTRIRWERGTVITDSPIRPSTDGTKVVIVGMGDAIIDGTGVGDDDVLDLTGAANVILEDLNIQAATGNPFNYSLIPGPHSTIERVHLDGGSGGLQVNQQGVVVRDVESNGHRDPDNGYAACIHISDGASDFEIVRPHIHDADRGIEGDDGPQYGTLYSPLVENIDNSQASSSGASFALDFHSHTGNASTHDITVIKPTIRNCKRGLSVTEEEDGQVYGITVIRPEIQDITTNSPCKLEADVTVVEPYIDVPDTSSSNYGIDIYGGSVVVRGGWVKNISYAGVRINEGSNTTLESVRIDDISIDGGTTMSRGIDIINAGSALVKLGEPYIVNTSTGSIRATDNSLGSSGWGLILTDPDVDSSVTLNDTGNTKCLLRGGVIGGTVTTPTNSVTQNVQ